MKEESHEYHNWVLKNPFCPHPYKGDDVSGGQEMSSVWLLSCPLLIPENLDSEAISPAPFYDVYLGHCSNGFSAVSMESLEMVTP